MGFLDGSVLKNLPASAKDKGDSGSIPELGRPPRRKWQPTPVFLPGIPMDRGAWQAAVHGSQSWTWLSAHARTHTLKISGRTSLWNHLGIVFSLFLPLFLPRKLFSLSFMFLLKSVLLTCVFLGHLLLYLVFKFIFHQVIWINCIWLFKKILSCQSYSLHLCLFLFLIFVLSGLY